MINCPNCNAQNPEGSGFCQSCGAALPAAPAVSTKKDFLNLPENNKLKKEISGSAIICYICAGITLAVGLALTQNPIVILDVLLLVGLGLGIHLKQSKACAIVLSVYALISMIISLVQSGRPNGYLILIAGVCAVIYTFKLDNAWKQYRQEHGLL